MPGDWPTLGCGNRRQHKARTYPYTIVELGTFPNGDPVSQAILSVDALGRAVGQGHGQPGYPYYNFLLNWYAAYWGAGGSPAIVGNYSTLTPYTAAHAGNLAGHVVGSYYTYGPYAWKNGFTGGSGALLSLPPGLSSGEADDINGSSAIIGFSYSGSNPQVVVWDFDGTTWNPQLIGAPAGGQAYAYALSDTKRICGQALFTVGGQWQGYTSPQFAADFSLTQPLGTFGGAQSQALDVNDVSGTVGWAHKHIGASDYRRAFLTPPDVFTLDSTHELPGFAGQLPGGTWHSDGYGVNGCRQVVGRAQDSGGAYRAFLFKPGAATLTDLNTVSLDGGSTPASLGWNLPSAVGISDAGHIVGSGSHNSATRQWMMYPTPQE